ncbi:ATP-binding protein [Streptomyces pseudovenezuelae]|uniref:ATP-binding protein n=1 Tax=Streptomyces pseudovenezuelae TaxID=67350 RepID=A0ABZ1XBG4_9ACTN|nr:ATP-binding protein [Streptomyces pseudovenezuelae]
MSPAARTRTARAPSARRQAPAQPRRPSPAGPRHYLSLKDAVIAPLPVFENLARGMEQTADQRAIMCVSGDAGVGKTFALDVVLAVKPRPARRARLLRLVPRPAPTPLSLRSDLADVLNLEARPKDPGAFDAALREVLAVRDHLLVVDEAQRLDGSCFEYLRYLFDDPYARLAIVLVVGERGQAVLRRQKMLASRTAVLLTVPHLTPADVAEVIPRFHPLWCGADPDALMRLDTRFCHGNFRRWAQATHHTLRLLRQAPARPGAPHPLLEDVLDATFPPRGEP